MSLNETAAEQKNSSKTVASGVIAASVVTPALTIFLVCGFGFIIRKKYQKWRISKKMILHNVQGKKTLFLYKIMSSE